MAAAPVEKRRGPDIFFSPINSSKGQANCHRTGDDPSDGIQSSQQAITQKKILVPIAVRLYAEQSHDSGPWTPMDPLAHRTIIRGFCRDNVLHYLYITILYFTLFSSTSCSRQILGVMDPGSKPKSFNSLMPQAPFWNCSRTRVSFGI